MLSEHDALQASHNDVSKFLSFMKINGKEGIPIDRALEAFDAWERFDEQDYQKALKKTPRRLRPRAARRRAETFVNRHRYKAGEDGPQARLEGFECP